MAEPVSKETFALIRELKEIKSSVDKIRKANFKVHFLHGLIYGLGTALGATVIFALAVFIYNQVTSIDLIKHLVDSFK